MQLKGSHGGHHSMENRPAATIFHVILYKEKKK